MAPRSLLVAAIFQNMSKKSQYFKEQKYIILDYMRNRHISKQVQTKVVRYLQYINDNDQKGSESGEKIIQTLSARLRQQIQEEYYGKILHQCQIFAQHFSPQFLNNLALFMHESTLAPGEIVFSKGEQDNRLYFLRRGELQEIIDREHLEEDAIVLGELYPGKYFGLTEFLTQHEQRQTVISKNISNIVYLCQTDFMQIIQQYPLDYVT